MRFDWKPESKERYFRKAEAAIGKTETSFPSSRERSRYISNRFREMGKHADGGRQRERLRTCMKCLRQKTSSAGNTRAFSYMLL